MLPTRTYRSNRTDGFLYNWSDINNDDFEWSSILIGNGSSINVWDNFGYTSIYDHAAAKSSTNPLTPADSNLFGALNTHNFEQVLSSLNTAKIINQALGLGYAKITQRYDSIKASLISAISEVHIPWRKTPDKVIETIRAEIKNFKYIYTTNYDLLIYWSIMHQNDPSPFTDYFFGKEFDTSDTNIYSNNTRRIHYLHGALHLYKTSSGSTLKRIASGSNLLNSFGQAYPGHPDAVPLLVSEGTSEDKLASINQSDYLTFVFNHFAENQGDIVVFGHSLSDSDLHIVEAMKKRRKRKIAISLRPDNKPKIISSQASLISKFPDAKLYFFDATTHPLGSINQKVTP